MSDIRRDNVAAAFDEYRRAVRYSARDQVVAEAEEEVCGVWTHELVRVRRVTELGVASAHAACQAAKILVREQRRIGNHGAVMRAQLQLEQARDQRRRSEEAARVLLAVVTEELDLLALAAEERDTVSLANRIWVSSASRAVCEAEIGGYDTPATGEAC